MKFGKFVLTAIYFLCSIMMFYDTTGSISIAGFGFRHSYLYGAAFVFTTFWYFLFDPDVPKMLKLLKYAFVLSSPFLFYIAWSLGLWVFHLSSFRQITRGVFFPVYQIIAILAATSIIYCFGWRGIYYFIASFFIAFSLTVLMLIRQGGLAAFIEECRLLITSFSLITGPMMAQLERPNFPQTIGIVIIYLLLTMRKHKIHIVLILLCIIPFVLGFKRSALFAIVAAFLIGAICFLFPKKYRKFNVYTISSLLVLASLGYIAFLRNDGFERITTALHIDTMARIGIYNAMKPYYQFTPGYLGRGGGFCSYMISLGVIDVGYAGAGDIHNDFLRIFVELGFIGFIIWDLIYFVYRIRFFWKESDLSCVILILISNIYCFTCYLTENMYFRYFTNLGIAIVIISYAFQQSLLKESTT